MQQQTPPSEPKPGMSGATADPAASGQAMGQKGAVRTEADPQAINNELGRGLQGIAEALFVNEQTSQAVMNMVRAEEKVGSAAKAAMFVTAQVIEKAGIAERVAVPMVAHAADQVMQMADETGLVYSEEDAKNVIMSATEMMLDAYGVSPERARAIAEGASPEQRKGMEEVYKPVQDKEQISQNPDPQPDAGQEMPA